MASQAKTGCQPLVRWHGTQGSANFEQRSEQMEYFEK